MHARDVLAVGVSGLLRRRSIGFIERHAELEQSRVRGD